MPQYLSYDGCSTSPATIARGEQFTVEITVVNDYVQPVTYDLSMFVVDSAGNDDLVEEITSSATLAVGQSKTHQYTTWAPTQQDDYDIYVNMFGEEPTSGGGGLAPAREPTRQPETLEDPDHCGSCGGY